MNFVVGLETFTWSWVLAERRVRTPDLGGHNSTAEMLEAVLNRLEQLNVRI